MEIALSKFCGPDDVITPITHQDEIKRRELGFPGPQNFKGIKQFIHGSKWDRIQILYQFLRRGQVPKNFWNHISARLIRERVGELVWNDYYKFTIVRHPIDVAISRFYFSGVPRYEDSLDGFSRFLRENSAYLNANWQIVSENDNFILDDFVRQEYLDNDLQGLQSRIGVTESIQDIMDSVKAKSDVRPKNGIKMGDLLECQYYFIQFACCPEFDFFGY